MIKTQSKNKWPYNSELYLTLSEIGRVMPKPDSTNLRITKPIKPNGCQARSGVSLAL